MKIVNLTNYIDFADRVCKQFIDLNDTFGSISVIALYNEAKQVIAACIQNGLDIASVKIDNTEYGDYYDEYIITIDQEGLWCEPFKRNGKYIHSESEIVYIFENCNCKVIERCHSDAIYEVCTDNYNEEYIDADMLCGSCGNDGIDNKCDCHIEAEAEAEAEAELHSVSLTVNQNGNFENYLYATSNKLSVNTMLDKIKNICV